MRNFRRAFTFLFQCAFCDKLLSEPYLWTNKIMGKDERKAAKRATWMKHLPSQGDHGIKLFEFNRVVMRYVRAGREEGEGAT